MKKVPTLLFLFLAAGLFAFGCGEQRPAEEDQAMTEQPGTYGEQTTPETTPGTTPPPEGERAGEPGMEPGLETGEPGGEESDAQLTASIQRRLQEEGVTGADTINVDVNNRVVTLTGSVSSEEEAQRIVNMIEEMENVDRVENKLEIRGS